MTIYIYTLRQRKGDILQNFEAHDRDKSKEGIISIESGSNGCCTN